jgi:hypothetical protein
MPVTIGSRLNRPVITRFSPTEFSSRDPGVGVNIRLDQGQVFVFRGIIASFDFTFRDEFDRADRFQVHGFENLELQYDVNVGTSILAQNPSNDYIYRVDEPIIFDPASVLRSDNRVAEFFATPIVYESYMKVAFAASLRRGGSVIDLTAPMEIYIEILGDVVNKNDEGFPWKYR